MNLHLSDDEKMLLETISRLLQNESSMARVRAAEETGFDPALWQSLVDFGLTIMRVPEELGGGGCNLLQAGLMAEQAGRHLASAPVIETLVTSGVLARMDLEANESTWESFVGGETIVALALADTSKLTWQLVNSASIASRILHLSGDRLLLSQLGECPRKENLADLPVAIVDFEQLDSTQDIVIAEGEEAINLFQSAIEEWKVLMSFALTGMGRRSLEIAAEYSCERIAFGQPIGSYQGLAHPMADLITAVRGAELMCQYTVTSIAENKPYAAGLISQTYWWCCSNSSRAAAKALHVLGGYGLSLEYDVQLYQRRAKGWPLVYGDPVFELVRSGERLWGDVKVPLPDAGEITLDFRYDPEARAFARETRAFFEATLTDELRAHAHHSWEGHHPEFHKALSKAGLLFPDWPKEYGGQGRNRYEMMAMAKVFNEFGWTRNAIAVTDMVGKSILAFGSDEMKQQVLPSLTSGEKICCLGFTEPSGGSDVFAAKTKAEKDGDEWVINGQKMFTSGADIADYVLILTRTDPNAVKHAGLTMFVVPMNTPGIEIHRVDTLADERTNITYYEDVRIPDMYRLGEVNQGIAVMAHSLANEQDGSGYALEQRKMVNTVVDWSSNRTYKDGRLLDLPTFRTRLARMAINATVAELLVRMNLWCKAENIKDRSIGPMSKLFASEAFQHDSTELLDLMAPLSLLSGKDQKYRAEMDFRLSTATTIYAGTSEIMRSIIAETALKMPRTRD